MICRECKIEIEARDLRRETLSGGAQTHLAACANCRAFGEERLALRQLIGGLEKVSAPPDFDFQLRARMNAEKSGHASRWLNFSPAALSWSVAGCLALVISASLYFQPKGLLVTLPQMEQSRIGVTQTQPTDEEINPVAASAATDKIPRFESEIKKPSSLAAFDRRRIPPVLRVGERRRVETARVEDIGEGSNVSSVMGSSGIFASNEATRSTSTSIPLQLRASQQPLEILLKDRQGALRTVSIDSVSFGSRDVINRSATFTNASLLSNQGVW
ncbi:MAG: hypothetical protein ACR2G4_08790 [Pyrinomonadaceae bacterium]